MAWGDEDEEVWGADDESLGVAAVATTFADPGDIARYRRAKARGLSDRQAFKVGDNGIGKWGDDTTAPEPIVALPRDLPGLAHNRLVEVTGPTGAVVARVADVMPKRENIRNGAGIDLNPAAAAAVGATGKTPVNWRFIDDPRSDAQRKADPNAWGTDDEVVTNSGDGDWGQDDDPVDLAPQPGVIERARELQDQSGLVMEMGDMGPVLLRTTPEAQEMARTPALPISRKEIRQEDSTPAKAGKAVYNTVAGFVEGATTAEGLEMLVNPFVGAAGLATIVPHLVQQVRAAEKTPPNSPERWQAGTDVAGFLAIPAIAHATVKGAQAIKGRDTPPAPAAPRGETLKTLADLPDDLAPPPDVQKLTREASFLPPEETPKAERPTAAAIAEPTAAAAPPSEAPIALPPLEGLPDYAKQAVISASVERRTNEGGSISSPDPFAGGSWVEREIAIADILANPRNTNLGTERFGHRGSVSKGPVVIDDRGELIDGNNRVHEAIKRGDKTIRAHVFHRRPDLIPKPGRALTPEEKADRFRTGREVYGAPAMAEEIGSPKQSAVAAPIAALPPPPVPRGQVLSGKLPVTLARTAEGSVSAPQVIDALKQVMVTAGSVGEVRTGRFNTGRAAGIFKPQPEVVRLEYIDNLPTAVHETGHALMKQFYGTVKARGLKWVPSAVRRELIGLGKALYGSTKPVAGYSGEGFAEFTRLYLTTDTVGKIAPNTLKFFEEGVMLDHPQVAQQLRAARSLLDIYRGQGALERVSRQLVREPGWTRRTLDTLKEFFTFQKQVESGTPLLELSREAKARGKTLAPAEDPYKLFKMKRGTSGAILERMVAENMVDVWGNPTGPGLAEAFAPIKGQRGEFLLYLFGKIAEKRWAEGKNPGISLEDAHYTRTTLERPEFIAAAQKYFDWTKGLLDYVAQADPSMQPLVDKLKAESFYAPLARMIDERAVRREAALAQSNPLYRMHGSGLPVKDIFDQTLVNAARLINRANRSLVTNAVVKLASIEGMGRVIEEVPIARVRQQFNVEQIRADLEKLGLDTSVLPQDEILSYYTAADQPKGSDPIVPVRQPDGSTKWFYVDPKIYDVLNKLEPFTFRAIPHIGFALDLVLGVPKRTFTLGTTGLRPAFSLLTNPLRDPQGWILQTKAGLNPAKMAAAYLEAAAEQLVKVTSGHEGPLSHAAYNLGAHMSQPLGLDIRYTKRATNELFHGRFMRLVRNPIDHARELLGAPESVPRLAEFRRVADEIGWKPGTPMSPDQAVQLSLAFSEATVDFRAAGDVSRILNEAIPFYNPAIQGMRTAGRAFRDHPLRTTLVGLAMFTGPSLALWWRNKDQEWYRNLPWRERYYYTNIDDGKNVWQIPRAFEWGNLFQTLPEAALDSWYRQEPEALKEAVAHIFETQNPLGYPVVLRVTKEQWQNRIDFWNRPIVPRGEENLLPGTQVGPYTSKVAIWLGQIAPETVSPRRVDAAVRGYFGGTVPDLMDAVGLGSIKKTRESELSDTPIVGKLWRRGGYYNAQSQYLADFWEIKQAVDARLGAVRAQMKDPSRPTNVKLDPRDVATAPYFEKVAKDISLGMRLANQMRESEPRRQSYRLMASKAKQAVELWNKRQQGVASNQRQHRQQQSPVPR